MSDKYLVYDRNTKKKMGILICDVENDYFSYEILEDKDKPWLHPSFYNITSQFQREYTSEDIKDWVMNRAPESYNAGIDVLIERAKLKCYDAYGFFKFNEGQFIQDALWCKLIEGDKVYTFTDFAIEHKINSQYAHPNGKI